MIVGDAVTLTEAFTNLIDNARKYAGDQYPVQIRVTGAAKTCMLRVDIGDRGPGIPDAEKDRVVERFSRGGDGHEAIGSGLGLAIVRAVADARSFMLLDRPGGGLVVRLEPTTEPVRAEGQALGGGAACNRLAAVMPPHLSMWHERLPVRSRR